MNFTYSEYKRMIEIALQMGYNMSFYDNIDSHDKAIILRHDIDFDLEKALKIARLEYSLGVSSTYFVLLSTDFYNIFSKKSVGILNQILEMNHQIGLHFDEERYNACTVDEMKQYVFNEISILEKLLGKPVKTISMHRPTQLTLDSDVNFEGLINSYSSYFFKEMKYVSDSRMHWRENIFDIIESGSYNKIHILTHPFWYSNEVEKTKDKLIYFLNETKISRYDSLNNNFRNLSEFIKREDIK